MTLASRQPMRTNPFSTRFVRPGAVRYLPGSGPTPEALVARLSASGWRGQIVGPHGAGKSTLLASLAAPLSAAGRRTHWLALQGGRRTLPTGWARGAAESGANLLIVDGYEQLGIASRWALHLRCRWRGWGLLVTAHAPAGLPTLLEMKPRVATALAVVEQLLAGESAGIEPRVVAECFAAAGGNVRETLFALYDHWESLHR
ncbi:MAG: hypothetical protein DWQ37_09570 [Planctomycetota bacterium]|nr:MAG: hypothetical protein DWQ37_09570 [Planctomycetota bacterium]